MDSRNIFKRFLLDFGFSIKLFLGIFLILLSISSLHFYAIQEIDRQNKEINQCPYSSYNFHKENNYIFYLNMINILSKIDVINNIAKKFEVEIINGLPARKKSTSQAYITIHHSATNQDFRQIQDAHSLKWSSFAYHFFIEKDGNIMQAHATEQGSAHAKGYNYNSISICLQGNFNKDSLKRKQLLPLIKLINGLQYIYNSKVIGHRDIGNTDCPGENVDMTEIKRLSKHFHIFKFYNYGY